MTNVTEAAFVMSINVSSPEGLEVNGNGVGSVEIDNGGHLSLVFVVLNGSLRTIALTDWVGLGPTPQTRSNYPDFVSIRHRFDMDFGPDKCLDDSRAR